MASMALAGCDPAGWLAGRAGARIGAGIADNVPTPPAAVEVKPGGNACDVLTRLNWKRVTVQGVSGPMELLVAIGATVETARACP